MSSYKVEIDEIRKRVSENRLEQVRLTEKLNSLTKQRDEVIGELNQLGVDPNSIDQWLVNEEKQIKERLAECQTLMNSVQV